MGEYSNAPLSGYDRGGVGGGYNGQHSGQRFSSSFLGFGSTIGKH